MPLDVELVRSRVPGREIRWYEAVGSTMEEAVRLAEAGCPSGSLAGADEQTGGRGRYGRLWHSQRDTGLYFSIVLRLDGLDPATLSVVTFALGLAVAEAIETAAGVVCDLRWPNDVLAGGRKCVGILTEMHGKAIVSGIGININQSAFPADVAPVATSLRIESGREHSREELLVSVLGAIGSYIEILTRQGRAAILDLFTHKSSYVSGKRVSVELSDRTITGVTTGLTPDGFLKLRRDDGVEEIVIAGGVRPALTN